MQVSNTEIYYRAINFYLQEHPLLLNDLLLDLSQKLDHSRVVIVVNRTGHLALIDKYLLHVQRDNLAPVNEAINELYIKAENYKGLRESVDAYNNFDQISLAQQLQGHELLEMRRISAHLYKMNKRYETSIELSKKDELWLDATETAADSKDQELAEGAPVLLRGAGTARVLRRRSCSRATSSSALTWCWRSRGGTTSWTSPCPSWCRRSGSTTPTWPR